MASIMMSCDVCCSGIYVTEEEVESKADFGFVSTEDDTNVCQFCMRRIKSRYFLSSDAAAIQIVKDFSRYDLRSALGLS